MGSPDTVRSETPGDYVMDWGHYQDAFHRLCSALRGFFPVDNMLVCAIPRGGYIPGVHLSNVFGAELMSLSKADMAAGLPIDPGGRHLLVCDDIVDSGATYEAVSAFCRDAGHPYAVAAVLSRRDAPDIAHGGLLGPEAGWVRFPWEMPCRDPAGGRQTGGPRQMSGGKDFPGGVPV